MVLGIIIGRVAKVEPGGHVEKVVGWDIGKIWTDFLEICMRSCIHAEREKEKADKQGKSRWVNSKVNEGDVDFFRVVGFGFALFAGVCVCVGLLPSSISLLTLPTTCTKKSKTKRL